MQNLCHQIRQRTSHFASQLTIFGLCRMQLATSRTLTATQGLVFLKTCIDCCIYSFSNYADSCGVENVVILIGLYLQLIKVFTNFVSRALNTNLALFSNDNPLCL